MTEQDNPQCTKCGAPLSAQNAFCGKCGQIVAHTPVAEVATTGSTEVATTGSAREENVNDGKKMITRKPPAPAWVMGLASLLIVGLGQIIVGQWKKGLAMIALQLALAAITAGASAIPFQMMTAFDAWKVARRLHRGLPVGEWDLMPSAT